jgi:hypothetical protein
MIPETHNAVVVLRQPPISDAVLFVIAMLAAVDLDDQSRFPADEIDNVGANWLLANKLLSFNRPRTQSIPQS